MVLSPQREPSGHALPAGHRVLLFLQENKTTDFYFPPMAAWGAAIGGGMSRRLRTSTSGRPMSALRQRNRS